MCFGAHRLALAIPLSLLPVSVLSGGLPNMVPNYMKVDNAAAESEPWDDALSATFLGGVIPQDGESVFEFGVEEDTPNLSDMSFFVRQSESGGERIERLRILIDNNTHPLAADFAFGAGMTAIDLQSQVCFEKFSAIRAVATVAGGKVFEQGRYIRSSADCHGGHAQVASGEIALSFLAPETGHGEDRKARLEFGMPTGDAVLEGEGGFACRLSVLIGGEPLFDFSGARDAVCGLPVTFAIPGGETAPITVRAEIAGAAAVERVFQPGS